MESFKTGIGIDYGEMLILKTGIQKRHEEQSEYKNLVWVGDTANIASKLTDFSSKEYNSPTYKITYEYTHFEKILKGYKASQSSNPLLDSLLGITPKMEPDYEFKYETRASTIVLSSDDFNKHVKIQAEWKYNDKKIKTIEKIEQTGTTSSILMSGKVFTEFKKAVPTSPFLKTFTLKQYPNAPYTGSSIYGGYAFCPEFEEIKL